MIIEIVTQNKINAREREMLHIKLKKSLDFYFSAYTLQIFENGVATTTIGEFN